MHHPPHASLTSRSDRHRSSCGLAHCDRACRRRSACPRASTRRCPPRPPRTRRARSAAAGGGCGGSGCCRRRQSLCGLIDGICLSSRIERLRTESVGPVNNPHPTSQKTPHKRTDEVLLPQEAVKRVPCHELVPPRPLLPVLQLPNPGGRRAIHEGGGVVDDEMHHFVPEGGEARLPLQLLPEQRLGEAWSCVCGGGGGGGVVVRVFDKNLKIIHPAPCTHLDCASASTPAERTHQPDLRSPTAKSQGRRHRMRTGWRGPPAPARPVSGP